jgi:hypothetical protein
LPFRAISRPKPCSLRGMNKPFSGSPVVIGDKRRELDETVWPSCEIRPAHSTAGQRGRIDERERRKHVVKDPARLKRGEVSGSPPHKAPDEVVWMVFVFAAW